MRRPLAVRNSCSPLFRWVALPDWGSSGSTHFCIILPPVLIAFKREKTMSLQLHSQVAINCILSKGSEGLEGEGCVYDLSTPRHPISTPDNLRPGDFVKVRLWIPDEDSHISVNLAEVQWVKRDCIKVDLIAVSPPDQTRLDQFTASQHAAPRANNTTKQVLIRF